MEREGEATVPRESASERETAERGNARKYREKERRSSRKTRGRKKERRSVKRERKERKGKKAAKRRYTCSRAVSRHRQITGKQKISERPRRELEVNGLLNKFFPPSLPASSSFLSFSPSLFPSSLLSFSFPSEQSS